MASLDVPLQVQTKLRVFFIPSFMTSHILAMTDLARLLAIRPNVEPTIIITPANATLIQPTLDLLADMGRPVQLLIHPFPSVGLPPGIENLATAPSSDEWRIHKAQDMCQPVHESILRAHRPDAIIADVAFWWVTDIAPELSIPRITFYPPGVFPQVVLTNLFKIRSDIISQLDVTSAERVNVPDLPGPEINIPVSELPTFLVEDNFLADDWMKITMAQLNGFGVVVNTFYELEPEYCDLYRKDHVKRAYFVGPVAYSSGGDDQRIVKRGGNGHTACLDWLDGKEKGSVVYVCFGSWCHFTKAQLCELAFGLEESGKNFLWVVRGGEDEEFGWIPERWEERVRSRGLIIRGWAPQVAILQHKSVGAFMTHCGWNSLLEAASCGVPVLTWPLVFDQFINERLFVDVKGWGARVWEGGNRGTKLGEKNVVPRAAIADAVSKFMEPGGNGDKMRNKAQEMAAMAKAAMQEGGSSSKDLNRLIDDLIAEKGKCNASLENGK
ncbi:Glycosyltransferase [Rhynchospora pubera]|uniref:Glycosyltransferase n=1 Tax=Rhynchospora pubera TaxID=906938 RepID=A0AAV8DEC0_9POAL|nr:Glycosyltransferase [Rhynchospora pubera]KAJ4764618.1 Glycosyltransferase [Rhynchospora pubera]